MHRACSLQNTRPHLRDWASTYTDTKNTQRNISHKAFDMMCCLWWGSEMSLLIKKDPPTPISGKTGPDPVLYWKNYSTRGYFVTPSQGRMIKCIFKKKLLDGGDDIHCLAKYLWIVDTTSNPDEPSFHKFRTIICMRSAAQISIEPHSQL